MDHALFGHNPVYNKISQTKMQCSVQKSENQTRLNSPILANKASLCTVEKIHNSQQLALTLPLILQGSIDTDLCVVKLLTLMALSVVTVDIHFARYIFWNIIFSRGFVTDSAGRVYDVPLDPGPPSRLGMGLPSPSASRLGACGTLTDSSPIIGQKLRSCCTNRKFEKQAPNRVARQPSGQRAGLRR